MKLNIDISHVGRQRTFACGHVLRQSRKRLHLRPSYAIAHQIVQGFPGRLSHNNIDHRMVHEMRADPRQVSDHRDVVRTEVVGGTDTGQHQDLYKCQHSTSCRSWMACAREGCGPHPHCHYHQLMIASMSAGQSMTHESRTSFLAFTRKRGPFSLFANSTPTTRVWPSVVSKRSCVTLALTATVKFGRASTLGVRYADSVVTRRPFASMYVTFCFHGHDRQ